MSIYDKLYGANLRFKRKHICKSYREGRIYRVQQIVTRENDRPKVKTIIHQMF